MRERVAAFEKKNVKQTADWILCGRISWHDQKSVAMIDVKMTAICATKRICRTTNVDPVGRMEKEEDEFDFQIELIRCFPFSLLVLLCPLLWTCKNVVQPATRD